ncbi:MAG: benzoate/H(+) symporter BenE family transporter [Anaerolineae bacterium]|nr:benzoate/H(+) symporter BenE family transporter [Anaerolineae bacterium]
MALVPPQTTVWKNIRDLPGTFSLASLVAGFVITLVGFTGPMLIIIQAAQAGGLSDGQTASWLWSVTVGYGVTTIFLSLLFRQPILSPFNTAGAALLVTSLTQMPYAQAIGAYMVAALCIVALGISGLFGRVMALVPQRIFMAMLAGVLLRFGIDIFVQLPQSPAMVIIMIAVYFALKRLRFVAPTLGALLAGGIVAALTTGLTFEAVSLQLTLPQYTAPEFSAQAILTLSLPLVALSLSSQYAPGQAVLRASGYLPPINAILVIIGTASVLLAPFGGHGLALGALTAAIVTGPEAHPDPHKRYGAAVIAAFFHMAFGFFTATVLQLFSSLPRALIATVAGLALSGIIATSLAGALSEQSERDAATIAFLCTAANFTFLGIGSPFWGLVAGVVVDLLMRRRAA